MKNLVTFLLFNLIFSALAQERLGISNSNYSSTNAILLNPCSSADSKTFLQVNFVGANAYAFNNVGYIPNFSLWRWNKTKKIEDPLVSPVKLPKFFYGTADATAIGFVLSKRNFGIGFFTRVRTIVDLRGTPFKLTNILLRQDPSDGGPEDINVRNVKLAQMSWAEYGINFSYIIRKDRNTLVTAGGNLKYLTGIGMVYANLSRLKGYSNDSAINVDELRGRVRFNQTQWNSGRGVGADLGITYKKMLSTVESYFPHSTRSGCKLIDYKYKISFAVRDLGYIRFRKNTTKADLNASGYFYTNQTNDYYRTSVAADLNTSFNRDPIWASTPTSFVGSFDWNFENKIYLNTTVVKNLVPNFITGVQSPNLVSIAPRFESKDFEVALPLTLHRYLYPQLGVAFRYRTFVLGFDNMFPLIFRKKTYGLSAYFSIGFSLFKNQACRQKKLNVADCPPGTKTGPGKSLRDLFKRKKGRNKGL